MTATTVSTAAELAKIPVLVDAVEAFCDANGLPPAVAAQLSVVVDEIASNAVRHGRAGAEAGAGTGCLTVVLELRPGRVRMEVRDDGAAFDPLAAPPPDTVAALEDRPVGGLGIHLVRRLMDDVRYVRRAGLNVVTVEKSVPPS